MELILAFVLSLVPCPQKLGDDSFDFREAEHERCNNILTALLLPRRSEDPEIDRRLRDLRKRNLKHLDPVYCEMRFLREQGFEKWADKYLFTGTSKWGRTEEFFDEEVFGKYDRAMYLTDKRGLLTSPHALSSGYWYWYMPARNPRDFPEYIRWLDYYTIPAPMPRER